MRLVVPVYAIALLATASPAFAGGTITGTIQIAAPAPKPVPRPVL